VLEAAFLAAGSVVGPLGSGARRTGRASRAVAGLTIRNRGPNGPADRWSGPDAVRYMSVHS